MNEFEQQFIDKILDGLHQLELKFAEELGKLHGDLEAIRNKVEQSISIDTERLNKHSEELDDHSERLAKLEEWKVQFEKQIANRIAVSQSIATVAAVVIAFLLSKLL